MTAEQKMKALGWSLWNERPPARTNVEDEPYGLETVRRWYCWFISATGDQIMGCSAASIAGCWKKLAASIMPLMRKIVFASQQAPLPRLNKPKNRKKTKRKTRRS